MTEKKVREGQTAEANEWGGDTYISEMIKNHD